MEPIILGLVGVASIFGVRVLSKKQKKEKEEYYQLEKIQMVDFVQKILVDRVIFRKVNSTAGFLATHFQATDQGFLLDVFIKKDEIEFYLQSKNKGSRMYYQFVYNRFVQAGQVIKGEQDFIAANELLLRELEEKVIHYNWENPFAFYAKKTLDLFGDKKKPNPLVKKETTSPVQSELQQDIRALETLYTEIKQASDGRFDLEETHQLERLYHQDFQRLKEAFSLIQEKTPHDISRMKETLGLIEQQLRSFYEKANMHQKQTFERTVEIIKQRNK